MIEYTIQFMENLGSTRKENAQLPAQGQLGFGASSWSKYCTGSDSFQGLERSTLTLFATFHGDFSLYSETNISF